MEYAYIFTIGCSLTVLLMLFSHTCRHIGVAGSRSFLAQLAFITLWSAGALMELISQDAAAMLFWHNFQQIGLYGVSASCIYFAAGYGSFPKFKRRLLFLMIVPAIALVLTLTDGSHHIMSYGYQINVDPVFGKAVVMHSTPVGMLFMTYAFCLVLAALIMLGTFASKVSHALRGQVLFIMLSMAMALAFAFVKIAFLEGAGVNIPVVVIYLPVSLLFFYSLFRHSLFLVSPIARDTAFDVIEQGIVVADRFGVIVDRNPFAVQLFKVYFGIKGELTGKSMANAFAVFPQWVELAKANTAGQFEVHSSLGSLGDCYFRFKVYPLQADKAGTVTIIRDITARKLQEFELKNRADMDSLTGLLNRSGFMEAFMRHLRESEGPVSTLIIDMDKFKSVNDTWGHAVGDRVLVLFAELLRCALRQQDAIGRIGGDEFAASLPGVGREEALAIAERVRRKAAESGVEMENGETLHFTVSIGICDNTGAKPQAGELIKLADSMMYKAKRVSRNCCVVGE
jgi:diguanylate cyclase (GGDEF)-like protein